MDYQSVLRTPIQKARGKLGSERKKELTRNRSEMIEEAVDWPLGKSPVNASLGLFYTKPGNKVSEPLGEFDFRPWVKLDTDPPAFDYMWTELSRIPLYTGFEEFRAVLVLVYRMAYLVDHKPNDQGKLRYSPSGPVDACITEIEGKLDANVAAEDKVPAYGLRAFLHFLDLLALNEDVKYHHSSDGEAVFKAEGERTKGQEFSFEAGRINNLLSAIKASYLVHELIDSVLKNSSNPRAIDTRGIFSVTQSLMVSNGVCPAQRSELLDWFNGYIYEEKTTGR